MALTKVTGHVVLPTTNIEFHNTKSTGIVTFTHTSNATSSTTGALQITGGVGIVKDLHVGGNVTVGGTLTYDDVTNIDSIGIITARAGINVSGGNVTIANDLDVDGHTELDNLNIAGIATGTIFKVPDATNSAGATNHIAVGDSSDLKLYHDNNGDAYISNATGHLTIRNNTAGRIINIQPKSGANGVIARYEGAAELYHNNQIKLTTTSGGANITGVITASQFSSVNGSNSGFFKDNQLSFSSTGDAHIDHTTNEKDILFRLSKSSALDTTMMRIDSSSEQTKFRKYVIVGLQGGNDTALLGGGAGIGAMLILNHATTGRNTFLAGNNDSYLNVNHGNLGIGTANPSGKVDISADASTNMLMFNNRNASSASNFARMGYNSAAGVSILDIRSEGHIRLLTGGNNEIIRFASNGGVGIHTDKTRNTKNVSIAGVTRDYTNSGTDLVDSGGIILQPTISLPSTGQSYPGIFWSGNTGSLGRARAGILGVAASNQDATDLVFLTKNSGSGHGLYPSDERMRITKDGNVGINVTPEASSMLHIKKTSGAKVTIECNDSTDSWINFSAASNEMSAGFDKTNDRFTIANHDTLSSNQRVVIKSGGNVGLDELNPQVHLHVTGNASTGCAHFGVFGTNGGNSYVGNTPVVTISTDGNGNAGTNDEKAILQVGRGGGGAGANAVTKDLFRVNLGGTVQIGGAVGSNSDIDIANTKLTIKQNANNREDGIYIERSGERRGWLQYVGGGGGVSDGFCLSTNQLGTKTDVLSFDRDGRMYFINPSSVGAWFGALSSPSGDVATINTVSTSGKEASIGFSRSNSLGGVTTGWRQTIDSSGHLQTVEHNTSRIPLSVRSRMVRTQYGIDTQSNGDTIYTPGTTGFHGSQWITCGNLFPFFYLGERVSGSSSTYSADVLDVYASGHWNGYPKAVIIAHERYYKSGFAVWTFGPYINGSYTLEQVEGWGGYTGTHGNDRNGTVTITDQGNANTHSGQPIRRYTVTIANSGNYSYTRWYIGFIHTGRGVYMSDTSVADVTSSTSSGACCHMRDISQSQAAHFSYKS